MKKKKSLTVLVAFLIGMIVGVPIVNYAYAIFTKTIEVATGISIEVNGEKFIPKDANGKEVDVFIYNGTTYLPIRAISGIYESDIDWDGESQTVSLFKKVGGSSEALPELLDLVSYDTDVEIDADKLKKGEEARLSDYKDELGHLISELKKIDNDFDEAKYRFFINYYSDDGKDGIMDMTYYIGDKISTNRAYVGIIENGRIIKINDSLRTQVPNITFLSDGEEKHIIDRVDEFLKEREKINKENSNEKIDERKTQVIYDYISKDLKYVDTKFIISDELDGAIVEKTNEINIEY